VGSERRLGKIRQSDQWALNVDSVKYVNPTSGLWMSTRKNKSTQPVGHERRLIKIHQPHEALNESVNPMWPWTPCHPYEALNAMLTLRGSKQLSMSTLNRLWTKRANSKNSTNHVRLQRYNLCYEIRRNGIEKFNSSTYSQQHHKTSTVIKR